MPLELRVSNLGGEQCFLAAEQHWTLEDVRTAIERAIGVPAREQRILAGVNELKSSMELGAQLLSDDSAPINLTMIRRSRQEMERLDALPSLPSAARSGLFYLPFPPLGLASDGNRVLLTSGGGGARSAQEVPNVVLAHRYDECTEKMQTLAALNTATDLLIHLAFLPSSSLAFSPSSSLWLASCGASSKVLELSEEQNLLSELCEWTTEQDGRDPTQNVARCSLTGSLIGTGGTDGIVRIWDVVEPREPPRFKCACSKYGEVFDLDFSPDGQSVASCDRSGACRLWDTAMGGESTVIWYDVDIRLSAHQVRFTGEPGNPSVVIAATARKGPSFIGVFSTSGQKVKEVLVDGAPLRSLDVDTNGKWAGISLVNGDKLVYELPNLRCVQRIAQVHDLPATCFTFVRDIAVSAAGDRSMHVLALIPKSRAFGLSSWLASRAQRMVILLFIMFFWYLHQ